MKNKRAAYDRYGHAAFEGGSGWTKLQGGGFTVVVIFQEIFLIFLMKCLETFRGGGEFSRENKINRSRSYVMISDVSLEEAFSGIQKEIPLTYSRKM